MTRNKTKNEKGVVMMETLIMLPVYLVILAGVFWLGEMCLIRQTMNTAERLRLWESGNRLSNAVVKDSHIFDAFIEDDSMGTARQQLVTGVDGDNDKNYRSDFSAVNTSNGWGSIREGFIRTKTRRSEWSYGIADFTRNALWDFMRPQTEEEQIAIGRDTLKMSSRSGADGSPLASTMLFRRDLSVRSGYRSFSGEPVWDGVFREAWGGEGKEFIAPALSETPAEVSAYGNRYGLYVDWSE